MNPSAEHRAGGRARRGSRSGEAQARRRNGSPRRPKVTAAPALTEALLLLEEHLHALTARDHPFRRPSARYEDRCLMERVACLERDLVEAATESQRADSATLNALSTPIEVSLKRLAWDLEKSGRRLSEDTRKRAEEAATRRADAIAAELASTLGRETSSPRPARSTPARARSRAPKRTVPERALEVRRSPRAQFDAPHIPPWTEFVAIASRGAAIASRRMSAASRRVAIVSRRASLPSRAEVARLARLRPNVALTRAQAGGALAAVVGLATLTGITGVLSGDREGEVGNAYGSPGSGALHSSSPESHLTALKAPTPAGIANSRDRRHPRDRGHGKGHGGNGQAGSAGGAGSAGPGGVPKSSGSGTSYSGGDGSSFVADPAPAPPPAPSPDPSPTPDSDGPVTSTVRNLDRTASDAGVNTGVSGTTDDVTREVDRTVGDLKNQVSGATDGLLGD